MNEGIKKVLGPVQNKMTPIKSSTEYLITDRGQQMERWIEHYFGFYSLLTLDAVEFLCIMDELYFGHDDFNSLLGALWSSSIFSLIYLR